MIAIQKGLVTELKERIYEVWDRDDPVLDAYYKDYQQEFAKGYQRPASRAEILDELKRADIAYFGDYHTLRSAQSAVLSLLRELAAGHGKPVVLALEMLRSEQMPFVQQFLDGELSAFEFRRAVKWSRIWGFSWASFGRFLEFAAVQGAPVFGINLNADRRRDGLSLRDLYAGDLVAALTRLYPDHLIAVVFGDLHMAASHLPAQVSERLARFGVSRRAVRIYQNSETVYWKLVERRLEHVVDYVKMGRNVYCLMNASPLMKFQSMLNWQERASEMVVDDLDDLTPDVPGEDIVLEQVESFARTIADFLGIPAEPMDDLEVATAADLDFLDDLVQRGIYSSAEIDALGDYLSLAETAWFARAGVLYLANLSLSHAAEGAMRFLMAHVRPVRDEAVGARDDFYARALVEALAFFGSKIINPKRRAEDDEHWEGIVMKYRRRRRLAESQRSDLEVARVVARHREIERRFLAEGRNGRSPSSIFGLPTPQHVRVTRGLGRMLGETLFHAVSEGRVPRGMVTAAMAADIYKAGVAQHHYFRLLQAASAPALPEIPSGWRSAGEEE